MRLNKRASLLFLISLAIYLTLSFVLSIPLSNASIDLLILVSSAAVSVPAFLVPALLFRRREGFARFKAPRFSHIMLAVAIGVGAVYLNESISLINAAVFSNVELNSNSLTAQDISGMNPLNMLFSLALLPPLSEEFLMRGTLLESWRRYSPIGAAFVTAALFALLHMAPSSITVYFALGLLLAAVYLITRSVWLCVTVHFVNNFFSVISALLLRFGAFGDALDLDEATIGSGFGDLSALISGPLGLVGLAVVYGGLAAAVLVPLLLVLKGVYKRNKLGAYAPEEYPEGSRIASEPLYDPDTGKKLTMWGDPILWVAFGLLLMLNIIAGLEEFGVIGA